MSQNLLHHLRVLSAHDNAESEDAVSFLGFDSDLTKVAREIMRVYE